eukprot:7387708-Prymnesium_polylepis.1
MSLFQVWSALREGDCHTHQPAFYSSLVGGTVRVSALRTTLRSVKNEKNQIISQRILTYGAEEAQRPAHRGAHPEEISSLPEATKWCP